MTESDHNIAAGQTPAMLWWSLIAGFLAWGLDLALSYTLEQHSCSTGHHYVLHWISIVCALIALSGAAFGYAEFKKLPAGAREEGGSRWDRAHFQTLLGIGFSLSFTVVIIAGAIPRWILSPCE